MYSLNYDSEDYIVEQITGNLYRIRKFCRHDEEFTITFEVECRNYGQYFKIHHLYKNGRTYDSSRFHYKYIPLIREATTLIWLEEGLFSYTLGKFVSFKEAYCYRFGIEKWEECYKRMAERYKLAMQ